jgi:tetratricopeptide (TPR) repeat protein
VLQEDPSLRPPSALLAALALAATVTLGPGARGLAAPSTNPYDAEQRKLAKKALRRGRQAEGVLPVLKLWNRWNRATPATTVSELERLADHRRLSPARRAFVGALLARARLRTGDVQASDQLVDELGYVTRWRVVGPFDNEGKAGFDEPLPPEKVRMQPVNPDVSWAGKEQPVRWRKWPRLTRYGYVGLGTVLRPTNKVCGYAETFIESERSRPLTLWTGAGGAVAVWWNGKEVLRDDTYRRPFPDRHATTVGARKGANRLLVKVCATDHRWGFFLRLGGPRGAPAEGLKATPTTSEEVVQGHADVRLPDAPEPPLEALERAADGDAPRPGALENLARFLHWTKADDPSRNRARQLARRAADDDPTVERLRLAAELAGHRGEVMRLVKKARELAPEDPRVLLMRAEMLRGGPRPEEALPVLDQLPDEGTAAWEGALMRSQILRSLDMPAASLRVLERAVGEQPGAPRWIRQLAEAARAADRADRSIALRKRAVKTRYDDMASRRVLAADALRRQDSERLKRHLGVLHELATTTRELRYLASMHEGRGDHAGAMEALEQAHELAPHDAEVLVAQGRLLLRMQQPQAAASAFRDALALRPQDPETRQILEQISPRTRRDEQYALGRQELLKRRVEGSGYPLTVLQDLTVNTVYDNGLGASFKQIAVQIHDDEGARRWRTYSIQYDPGSQRVQLRHARVYRGGRVLEANRRFERDLGKPWYRIYYDTRAKVVVFPDLEPGDVVELQYRIDDVAHRNIFADYYGDLHFLKRFEPVVHQKYVLVTPKDRTFHFNDPSLAALEHERTFRGDRRIDQFVAENVEPIRREHDMPGMTEVAPYLHVSTYETWEQVGEWYWGLIRDQLYADDSLEGTVEELIEDAPDLRTKVERIHNWVVGNTRYVALEFGIHGYKPYRVPQVVQRGFGDCKDKASLMYTMFEKAGIDAHIVLVRTRRNGRISDQPASLAVFDHAIAYVPELDLYLDGTAEHSGTRELPPQDQGVTVLHVWPGGSDLRRTPVLPPERNKRTRKMTIRLAPDGSARIDVEETVRGAQAPKYRRTYQAEGTRQSRFERSMRRRFPGLHVTSLNFQSVEDLEKPVRLEYEGAVPSMADEDGGVLRLGPTVLDDLVENMARAESRQHPLDLGRTRLYVEDRTVRVPTGMKALDVPEGGAAESEFGRLEVDIETDGQKVRAHTEFELRKTRISPENYSAFREWIQQADSLLRGRFRIGKERE